MALHLPKKPKIEGSGRKKSSSSPLPPLRDERNRVNALYHNHKVDKINTLFSLLRGGLVQIKLNVVSDF